jgi:hypothetical protein
MPIGHLPRQLRLTRNTSGVQIAMLLHQHLTDFIALRIHTINIGQHIALEQIEQGANGVQQYGVMTGLGNRQMEARVGCPLLLTVNLASGGIALL